MSRAFNGNLQYLDSAPQAISSQLANITMCAWVKPLIFAEVVSYFMVKDPDALFTNAVYVDGDSGYNNGFGGFSESATANVFGESDTLADVLTPNAWAHLAYSASFVAGGEPKLYLNGVLITEYNNAQSVLPPNTPVDDDSGTPWRLGGYALSFPALFFHGEMADVRIYNAVLTDGQVASVAAGGNPVPSNLVAWWKLLNADPFADSSGNGNTLTNFGSTPGTSNPPIPDPPDPGGEMFNSNPLGITGPSAASNASQSDYRIPSEDARVASYAVGWDVLNVNAPVTPYVQPNDPPFAPTATVFYPQNLNAMVPAG